MTCLTATDSARGRRPLLGNHEVNAVDYVRNTMVVDVRYRVGAPISEQSLDHERRREITLDVVHADDAALVADLERRLGGQVMHHQVREVDYVRDIMVVDVRYRAGSRITDQSFTERFMAVEP